MNFDKIVSKCMERDNGLNSNFSRSACWYGEMLRNFVFIPDSCGNDFGCYSTFEFSEEFFDLDKNSKLYTNISNILLDGCYEDISPSVKIITDGEIFAAWYWDGDGTLLVGEIEKDATDQFEIKRSVLNTDCKKDYVWTWVKK